MKFCEADFLPPIVLNMKLSSRLSLVTVICSGVWMLSACRSEIEDTYYPKPDSEGGWRTVSDSSAIRDRFGMDTEILDEAFEQAKVATKNGGLLVLKDGWLVYERYFGKGHREAAVNLASIGKSFTSVSMGILLSEQPEAFPDGLEQNVYTPDFLPAEAFPLQDERKSQIKLVPCTIYKFG
jgi:hypothetical protein